MASPNACDAPPRPSPGPAVARPSPAPSRTVRRAVPPPLVPSAWPCTCGTPFRQPPRAPPGVRCPFARPLSAARHVRHALSPASESSTKCMRHASPKLVGHGRTRNCAISRASIPFFRRNVSNTRASPRKRPSLGEPPLQAVTKSAGQRRGATPRRPQAASRRPSEQAWRAPVDTHREKTGTPGTRFAHEELRGRIFGLKSAVRLRKRRACTQRGRRTTPAHSVPP